MKKINSNINNYTDHIYYICRTILIIGLPLTIISGLVLSLPHSSAIFSGASSDSLTLSLPSSCTLSSTINTAHDATMVSGTYLSDIGKTTIKTLCNDGNGYAIYANGFSNNIEGNNLLISNISNGHDIATGLATSGDTSNWAMKLNNVVNDSSPTPPTIETPYNNTYGLVPNIWTKVAGKQSGTTNMITGSSFTTTYAVYTAPTQHAGTYTGQVAYALIHAYEDNLVPNIRYMQDVANWKNELVEDQAILAVDKRDFKTYYVTKLKDGHIWMTQNLDFNINVNTTLSSMTTDLNVTYNSTTGQYAEYDDGYSIQNGIIYWTPASTATTIDFTGTTVTGWQNSNMEPYSASKTDDTNTGHNSLGNWYNWTSAIASNNSNTLTNDTLNDISQNPQNSICPKGWRLPTISNANASIANSTNEFSRLNFLYNNNMTNTDNGLISKPLYFVKSGSIDYSNLYDLSSKGYYLSSTPSTENRRIYYLSFDNNVVNTSNIYFSHTGYSRNAGFSIRCLAR